MDTDFVIIVNYACPRCHAPLEARSVGPPSWVRCPSCGRACLPPEDDRISTPAHLDDPAIMMGTFLPGVKAITPPSLADPFSSPPPPLPPTIPAARVLLGSGFFVSMALFVFSLLEGRAGLIGVFGLAAVTCLIFLTRRPGRPRPD